MDRFVAGLMQHAGDLDGQRAQPRWGTVQSVDPATGTARVLIQPEGVLSGWLPVLSPVVGGAQIIAPLTQGEQVFMVPDTGDANSYVIMGMSFSGLARPSQLPAEVGGGNTAVRPGEVALVAAGGAMIRLSGTTIFMRGNLIVDGDVSDKHGSLDRLRGNYNAHRHSGGTTTDHVDPE